MRKIKIISTTDNKYIGDMAETDLFQIVLPDIEPILITGRAHRGNGEWVLWNSEYTANVVEIMEGE